MKNTMFAATVLAAGFMTVAGTASADGWTREGVYGSVKGGWSDVRTKDFGGAPSLNVKSDDGMIGSAALGVKHGNVRTELEAIYQEADVKNATVAGVGVPASGETQFYGAMANAYYDFKNSSRFTPYVGAGVGYGKVRYSNYATAGGASTSSSDDTFAYQGIAGVGYELNPCWTLTGEYRYLGTTKAALAQGVEARHQSHSALAGLRYTF